MTPRTRAHLALIAANLIYGANFSIAKIAMPEFIQPQGFILLRVAFSFLLFWLLSRISVPDQKVERKDHLLLCLMGFSGVAINQMLFFEGLARTSNINAALILTTNPVMVLLAASFLYKERLTFQKIIGILLGIGGAFSLIISRDDAHGSASWQGDLLVFLNAAAYAVFMVGVKPLMRKYSPWLVIRWCFFYGMLLVIPFGFHQARIIDWSSFTPAVWISVVFVIFATTFLTYWFTTFGLQHLSSAVVSYYIYLQPVFATLISLVLTHESVNLIQIIACFLIFTGVYLVNRNPAGTAPVSDR